ncbi:MAG: FAD binding domain-containing protein [Dehalococcoidia bacterium]|nr:MAG: FAD binding domain-containing protein [Dehalococcoidia bacterium]
MKEFTLVKPLSIDDAVSALGEANSAALAGGTDLLGKMKSYYSPTMPDTLVNLKTIPDMAYIKEESGMLKIGALTTLTDIAESSTVKSNYSALAEAARKVATPELRNAGTIGGNLCQGVWCWYLRTEWNHFNCLRKNPNGICQALLGDNRYHSIFGAVAGCVAVNPSDTAPALVALDAKIVTTNQTVDVGDFFTVDGENTTILDDDEIVTEIQVPTPASGTKSAFIKYSQRKSFDFALVSVAVARAGSSGRICLGGVYNLPMRAESAEAALPDAEAAGEAAASGASALPNNSYKIQLVKTLVKRAVATTA